MFKFLKKNKLSKEEILALELTKISCNSKIPIGVSEAIVQTFYTKHLAFAREHLQKEKQYVL